MELEMFEEPLQMLVKFEDQVLAPSRVATIKDLTMEKVQKNVEWAKLLDQLSIKMDAKNETLKHLDRLFLALLDNPRLPGELLKQYIPCIYADNDKLINNAQLCLEQRDFVRKELLTDFLHYSKENVALRELLRSDRGEYSKSQSKVDVRLALLKETLLSTKMKSSDKMDLIQKQLKSPDFKSNQDLRQLLTMVEEINANWLKELYSRKA